MAVVFQDFHITHCQFSFNNTADTCIMLCFYQSLSKILDDIFCPYCSTSISQILWKYNSFYIVRYIIFDYSRLYLSAVYLLEWVVHFTFHHDRYHLPPKGHKSPLVEGSIFFTAYTANCSCLLWFDSVVRFRVYRLFANLLTHVVP